jgi:hypothetical protein
MSYSGFGTIDEALRLARLGVPVMPIANKNQPLTPNGFYGASTDPATLTHWFDRRWPWAGLAVRTGKPGGYFGLDLDFGEGKEDADSALAWWRENAIRIPTTRAHRSASRSMHLIFHTDLPTPSTKGRIAPGVDTRADLGYLAWPPTRGYALIVDEPIARLPDWLRQLCLPPPIPPPSEEVVAARREWFAKAPVDAVAARVAGVLDRVSDARPGQRDLVTLLHGSEKETRK